MKPIEVLIAWLDAGRRRDREAMLALLAPDAIWQGVRPEWRCGAPDEIVATWVDRSQALGSLDTAELAAVGGGATLTLRAGSLADVDPMLRGGVRIAFEFDGDGRIARLIDTPRAPSRPPEAPVIDGRPQGPGWFVVNAADAPWVSGRFGSYTGFEGDARFERIGLNIGVLEPGQPACWYHEEDEQEDFLVLRGEALLLVEGEERPLRAWDFVHCPPWTAHVFVGAGDEPCTLLALGGRSGGGVLYPVSELALRHGAGVEEATTSPREAYADVPPDTPVAFDPRWLP